MGADVVHSTYPSGVLRGGDVEESSSGYVVLHIKRIIHRSYVVLSPFLSQMMHQQNDSACISWLARVSRLTTGFR